MFLILCSLGLFLLGFLSFIFKSKKNPKHHNPMPLQKNYTNPYIYFADLDKWNEQCYEDYLSWCAEHAEIPIDKQKFSIQHESRKNNFKNLIK